MMDTFLKGISNHLELPYLECVHHVSEWVFTMSPVHTKGEGAEHVVKVPGEGYSAGTVSLPLIRAFGPPSPFRRRIFSRCVWLPV
jgi:hypothetical protein